MAGRKTVTPAQNKGGSFPLRKVEVQKLVFQCSSLQKRFLLEEGKGRSLLVTEIYETAPSLGVRKPGSPLQPRFSFSPTTVGQFSHAYEETVTDLGIKDASSHLDENRFARSFGFSKAIFRREQPY